MQSPTKTRLIEFLWQPETNLDVFVDMDFAGCLTTRWNTSGHATMRGRIQSNTGAQRKRLNSTKAELCGIVNGTTEALRIQSVDPEHTHTDSAATVGICKRTGVAGTTPRCRTTVDPRKSAPRRLPTVPAIFFNDKAATCLSKISRERCFVNASTGFASPWTLARGLAESAIVKGNLQCQRHHHVAYQRNSDLRKVSQRKCPKIPSTRGNDFDSYE